MVVVIVIIVIIRLHLPGPLSGCLHAILRFIVGVINEWLQDRLQIGALVDQVIQHHPIDQQALANVLWRLDVPGLTLQQDSPRLCSIYCPKPDRHLINSGWDLIK